MENTSGFEPVDHRVLVKPDPVEEKTAGGIILADTSKDRAKYAGTMGVLVAKGVNAFADWGPGNGVDVGSRVHFAQYTGARIKGLDEQDYIVMNDEDLTLRGAAQ